MPRRSEPNQPGRANTESPRASNPSVSSVASAIPGVVNEAVAPRAEAVPKGVDHTWVVRLMKVEGPAITRMLWRLLGSEPDVQDAYQDCFCKLATRANRGDVKCEKAYAFRTAANIAVEMIRKRNRRRAHWPAIVADQDREDARNVPQTEESENQVDLRAALSELPNHLRNVVILRDLSKMTYEEVGITLGIAPATARVYRRHAVVKLAELLGEGSES